jgi:hypothetical protein
MLLGGYKGGIRLIGGRSTDRGGVAIDCDEFYLTDYLRILFQECNLVLEGLFIRCRRRFRVCSCLGNECVGSVVPNKGGK